MGLEFFSIKFDLIILQKTDSINRAVECDLGNCDFGIDSLYVTMFVGFEYENK